MEPVEKIYRLPCFKPATPTRQWINLPAPPPKPAKAGSNIPHTPSTCFSGFGLPEASISIDAGRVKPGMQCSTRPPVDKSTGSNSIQEKLHHRDHREGECRPRVEHEYTKVATRARHVPYNHRMQGTAGRQTTRNRKSSRRTLDWHIWCPWSHLGSGTPFAIFCFHACGAGRGRVVGCGKLDSGYLF